MSTSDPVPQEWSLQHWPEDIPLDLEQAPESELPFLGFDGDTQLEWAIPEIQFNADVEESTESPYLDWEMPVPLQPKAFETLEPQSKLLSDWTFFPSPTGKIRSMIKRSVISPGAQKITSLMMSILKSYPKILLHNDSMPPFVHPCIFSLPDLTADMEPLYNCMNLMQLLNNNFPGSRKLFWRNVRTECEIIRAKYKLMDKWELMVALQALCIYILVRIEEGETEYNNHDFLLLTSVTVSAKKLNQMAASTTSAIIADDKNDLESLWKNWILQESFTRLIMKDRLCVVYQVINMLVDFEPAAMCDNPSFMLLNQLPSKKQLWDARDAHSWKLELDSDPKAQISFALTATGDLIKLDSHQAPCNNITPSLSMKSTSNENWQEWCSSMDGLGSLIMLAASLVADCSTDQEP